MRPPSMVVECLVTRSLEDSGHDKEADIFQLTELLHRIYLLGTRYVWVEH